jgi:predicted nucleic acid-binding protein
VIVADASFWVAAFLPQDAHHEQSARLLRRMVTDAFPVFAPTLALVEIAGAVTRRTGTARLAEDTVRYLKGEAWLTLSPLSLPLSESAARIAIACSLRGGDAVYAALARQENAPLVTLDDEMLQRAGKAVVVMTPEEWLRQNPAAGTD